MTREDFDAYCASLKSVTHVVQWGDESVWKVGGKMFAIFSDWGPSTSDDDEDPKISFKCSDLSYDILRRQDGIVPAPYLARAKWVQVQNPDAMSDDDLRGYIEDAHALISAKLTKAKRTELGL